MKNPILALTLISSSALFGAYHDTEDFNYNEGENSSTCCSPCCTPQPKKCIDCECYTPKYYDLQCDWGLFVSGEFLYWYARETHLSYAAVLTTPATLNDVTLQTPSSVKAFGVSWDPGFRVGIGYNWRCDGWDTYLNWTSFCNSRSDSVSVASLDDGFIVSPWAYSLYGIDGDSIILSTPWTSVKGKWSLNFNQIDLELGRKYWLSKCFSLRPYAGLRGQWLETTLKVDSNFVTSPNFDTRVTSATDSSKITDDAWGGGFLVGIQPNWHLCSNFIIYSNWSGSLTWGEYKSKRSETFELTSGSITSTLPLKFDYNFYGMLATIDLGIGFRWEENWCCDRYRTSLDLGWEHHLIFDYNHRIQFTGLQTELESSPINAAAPTPTAPYAGGIGGLGYSESGCTLSMGGFVLRVRVDF